jgi:cephalosporin-C deacetylase-like acetyl esterase
MLIKKQESKRFSLFLFLVFIISVTLRAQPIERLVKVAIAPDHADWVYKKGENAKFKVTVTRNSEVLQNVKISYEVGPEMMTPTLKDSAVLKEGVMMIEGGTLKDAGFLRCRVVAQENGVKYEGLATAAFNPELIKPTVKYPTDFIQFWNKAKSELATIPLDVKLTLLPERCTELSNVYQANIQNYKPGMRLYGIVSIPKKPGKYPALLRVPGAGVRPYYGDPTTSDMGVITFEIGIHGIPVTMDQTIYNDLGRTTLDGYPTFNLDDRDKYYYKRVYLGCVRAIDFIFSLPQFDGSTLAVTGGSQGGALSIVTAGLDPRVKYLAAFYPALCDLTGYFSFRAGGWPHMFRDLKAGQDKIETASYYDVVNFAKNVRIPGFYSWGYNDVVCPPTSTYSAYNSITAPKELLIMQETGHWTYPEQTEKSKQWLMGKLLGNH